MKSKNTNVGLGPNLGGMAGGRGAGARSGTGARSTKSAAAKSSTQKSVTKSVVRSAKQVAMKTSKKKSSTPKSLYHGTYSEVQPGRKLVPSSSATKYYEFANRFAKVGGPGGRVYKVKVPSDAKRTPRWTAPRTDEWLSQKGFTVVKEAKPPRQNLTPQMRTPQKPKSSGKRRK